ncbi:MAG: hypothetical protein J6O04_08800 [Selenomonadaceae bacterium]|nr:hypothetical protein [Selenomonadaceae bacterium]
MLAIKGYYDGTAVQLLEKTKILPNQKLIIMVTDEFIKKPKMTEEERQKKIEELGGSLSEDAIKDGRSIDEIVELESKAWEEAVVEKERNKPSKKMAAFKRLMELREEMAAANLPPIEEIRREAIEEKYGYNI